MSKNYTQLSLAQRYQIEALVKVGVPQKVIAAQVGVHSSTISRELQRNIAKRGCTAGLYKADNAHQKTTIRHQTKAKQILFSDEMKKVIEKQLQEDKWSPELISRSSKRKGKAMVSHERIYQWIWECKHTNKRKNRPYKKLYQCLKHGKRRRKRGNRKDNRAMIPNRVSIEKRPAVVNKRKRIGDIEVDLMVGKNHKGAILVMTDRATLHTRLHKLSSKESKGVGNGIIKCLTKNNYSVNTITFDNDRAFCCHEVVGKTLKAKTYFTRPYTSQDKGTVENRIGVLRRFFPKKTDLTAITHQLVKNVERKLNNRPVRKFNYLTPNHVLQQKIALIT